MEPKFTTSFIPKKQVAVSAKGLPSFGSGFNFTTLLSSVILVAVVLFAAGLFLYRLTVEKRIEEQFITLQRVKESFDPNFLSQATRLNKRIVSSVKILDSHLAPSAMFDLLEEFSLQTISFKTFEFADDIEGKVIVKGDGEGDSFASVVLQSDEFGKSGYMRDVLFSNLQPNAVGNVNFSFEATIDPQLVLYSRGLVPVQSDSTDVPDVEQLDIL
jgi:hypothetical protein